MKMYDTEKELFMSDYRPLPASLRNISLSDLYLLSDNLEKALENCFIYGNDLLSIAIDMDIRKIDMYIRMREKQAKNGGKQV